MNRWNIPDWLEREVIARDCQCSYCGVSFEPVGESRGFRATWEHIINDARIINRENIARCCSSCNASKGAKDLAVWFGSAYCQRHGITAETIAAVAKRALTNPPSAGASAFYFLSLTLRTLPLGIAYAIWSGVGVILVALVGWALYQQSLDIAALIGISLIVAGVIVLNLFSKAVAH